MSHAQEHVREKNVFTGAPVTALESLHCSKKRAVKGASAYRNAKGQSPAKRKKVGATFHEEIHPGCKLCLEETKLPVEVTASYLRSGLMRNRPIG